MKVRRFSEEDGFETEIGYLFYDCMFWEMGGRVEANSETKPLEVIHHEWENLWPKKFVMLSLLRSWLC